MKSPIDDDGHIQPHSLNSHIHQQPITTNKMAPVMSCFAVVKSEDDKMMATQPTIEVYPIAIM